MSLVIGGFRGGAGGHAPQDAKVAFFALHMQCIIKICAVKLIKFIFNTCILGGFHAPKSVCFRVCVRRLALTQEVHLRSLLSASVLTFGASLPLVAPISGYAYVRVGKK